MVQRDVKRYCREVRGWLPCSLKQKKKILGKMRENLARYLEEDPLANYSAIVARFGTPQQIAAAYVDEMGTPELLNDLRIKRKIIRIVATVGIAFVLLWAITMGVVLLEAMNQLNGIIYISEGL